MDNNKGRYGLMGTVKALLVFRIFAVVAALGSIAVMFAPWLNIKVKKYDLTYDIFDIMSLDSWYHKKYPKGCTKLEASANGASYSRFMTLLWILCLLYIIIVAAQLISAILTFVIKKGLLAYKIYRFISLLAIIITVVLLCFLLSLPGSKSHVFLDSMFSVKLCMYVAAFIQVLVFLLFSKKLDDESQSLSFFFFEDLPSISKYKKILAEAGIEEN